MLKAPIRIAETNAAAEYDVLICPVMPTDVLNVLPMSIRRRAAKTDIGPEAKLAATSEGRNILLWKELGISSGFSSIFRNDS